ncbi:MAG: DUF3304 domain-containing protein, partial [Ralstonia mannitolilytica]
MRALKKHVPHLYTTIQWLAPFLVMGLIVSCLDNKATVEITGYDHMQKRAILWFTVNDASGPNLFPESGGGKYNCCIEIPKRWHRGMKATVRWEYGTGDDSPRETVVDIPEYTSENIGPVQVHFYDNHRVKVVVSKWALGNAEYPLPKEDWAPWTINERWERNIREIREEGGD